MFEPLPAQFDFPAAEKRVLEFWKQHDIFARSIEQRRAAGAPRFVFYEGPPTANGMPHPGHALTRAIKDIFPRYRAMTGHLVERKAGWDTHGLPVEVEVCKELGIHTKEEIEAYGVEKFVLKCISSVWRYTREWEELTSRLGFWVDLKDAYATYHQYYVESVWWSLKMLFERGLLYQGHKIVWWWCQGGTALSSGEVGEGYRQVDDPSVFVKFPLVESDGEKSEPRARASDRGDDAGSQVTPSGPIDARYELWEFGQRARNEFEAKAARIIDELEEKRTPRRASLLVWTTTPWTLISNHFAAVNPELEYALVEDPGPEGAEPEYLYIAAALVEQIGKKVKRELRVISTCKGIELIGLRYEPPFKGFYDLQTSEFWHPDLWAHGHAGGNSLGHLQLEADNETSRPFGWRVLAAEFVKTESGTGIVHIAPAFGVDDLAVLEGERGEVSAYWYTPLLCAVAPNGEFNDVAPTQYRGRWIKDCDKEIVRELRDTRKTPWGTPLLYHQEQYRHDYPFCPRAPEDPLIQYARNSWFVRTSDFKDEFLSNSAAVNWLPEHIKEGRIGDFLRNNVDWALSRERYWGTPLPIWECERCAHRDAISSFDELRSKPGATDGGFWESHATAHRSETGEDLPTDLSIHKPYIDEWTYNPDHKCGPFVKSTWGGGSPRMKRVPEVIDCWWDAGSMPFAQWGFPHKPGSAEKVKDRFPADFISEAIDQTRGWFYGLLAISNLLFAPRILSSLADRKEQQANDFENSALGQTEAATTHARTLKSEAADLRTLVRLAGDSPSHACLNSVSRGGSSGTAEWLIVDYPHPFRTCIVLGHMFGEDGNKMSKRLRNYKEPTYIFDSLGADAMRWYFFSAQAPWTSTRFVEANIRDSQRDFLVRLHHVLSFFSIYASIDGFVARPTPECGHRPTAQRGELDRWIISELQRTVRDVRRDMDRFENYPAARRLLDFVDALSNWYVRRSRERFWRPVGASERAKTRESEKSPGDPTLHSFTVSRSDQDKWDAYHTLYGCLYTLSQLIAPFTPFIAESMYQYLVGRNFGGDQQGSGIGAGDASGPSSVHLCDYPVADESLIDEKLAEEMDLVREIVSSGRGARTAAKLKVRQPLARVEIILAKREHEEWLRRHSGLISEELNVKSVEFTSEADHYVSYQIKPDFKALGPKFGKLAPKIAAALNGIDAAEARRTLTTTGALSLTVDGQTVSLTEAEVQVRLEAKPGWSAAQGRAGVVVVSTELSPELIEEGLIRELIHHIQGQRKELNLPYAARIVIQIQTDAVFAEIVQRFADVIGSECLVERIEFAAPAAGVATVTVEIDEHKVEFGCAPITK